jgi:hypothetical protein
MTAISQYINNRSYREAIRQIIGMPDTQYIHNSSDYDDEETGDEQYYDEIYMSMFLDKTYALTREHPIFKELYEIAAGKMLSLNPEIGLAVLMSYDYLYFFYGCLLDYISSPDSFGKQNDNFLRLYAKIV